MHMELTCLKIKTTYVITIRSDRERIAARYVCCKALCTRSLIISLITRSPMTISTVMMIIMSSVLSKATSVHEHL